MFCLWSRIVANAEIGIRAKTELSLDGKNSLASGADLFMVQFTFPLYLPTRLADGLRLRRIGSPVPVESPEFAPNNPGPPFRATARIRQQRWQHNTAPP